MAKKKKYISGPENRLIDFLRIHFPKIQTQIRLHDQRLDAYIPECDTYIQLDGVYWHGLDESLEKPNAIIRKMRKDMLLNGMFIGTSSNSKLFRITDLQWKNLEENNSRESILDIIRGSPPGLIEFSGSPGYRIDSKGNK